jgi:hypothetical protein
MSLRTALSGLAALMVAPVIAMAQSTIDANHKHAWGENLGWTNWRDAYDTEDGVVVGSTYLSGFIWAENIGWINVGGGEPGDGVHYANVDGSDFGVNIDLGTGELFGLAWGENVGWINFGGGALATPPNPARLGDGCRLLGFAWGENVGWINLDDAEHFVGTLLAGDFDGDGEVALSDLAQLLANYGTTSGAVYGDGDIDRDGDVDLSDLAALLAVYGESCP